MAHLINDLIDRRPVHCVFELPSLWESAAS